MEGQVAANVTTSTGPAGSAKEAAEWICLTWGEERWAAYGVGGMGIPRERARNREEGSGGLGLWEGVRVYYMGLACWTYFRGEVS